MAGLDTNVSEHTRSEDFLDEGCGSGLFTLPLEVRLLIYNELLVCQLIPGLEIPRHSLGFQDRAIVILLPKEYYFRHRLSPSILRTCRQAYREAVPILYSHNIFTCADPWHMRSWMKQAGPANVRMLQKLLLRNLHASHKDEWIALLKTLAQEAIELRYLRVSLTSGLGREEAEVEAPNSLGKDVDFARSLAEIQGLEKLNLEGYYAVNWPRFFECNMNVPVDLTTTYERFIHAKFHYPSEHKMLRILPERVEWRKKLLKRYQEGTEDLWP